MSETLLDCSADRKRRTANSQRRGKAAPSIGFAFRQAQDDPSTGPAPALRAASRLLRNRSAILGGLGAPTPASAGIGPRQPLADQRVADVASVHRDVAQLAAVDVLVAVDARQGHAPPLSIVRNRSVAPAWPSASLRPRCSAVWPSSAKTGPARAPRRPGPRSATPRGTPARGGDVPVASARQTAAR
jgi:hypothetical protein